MGGQHGTQNLELVLDVLAEGGNVAEKMVQEEGGFLTKAKHLTDLTDELFALTRLNGGEFKLEAGELDAEDLAKLNARFQQKFDLQDDVVEGIVEEGVLLAQDTAVLVKRVLAFAGKIKAAKKPAEQPQPTEPAPAA